MANIVDFKDSDKAEIKVPIGTTVVVTSVAKEGWEIISKNPISEYMDRDKTIFVETKQIDVVEPVPQEYSVTLVCKPLLYSGISSAYYNIIYDDNSQSPNMLLTDWSNDVIRDVATTIFYVKEGTKIKITINTKEGYKCNNPSNDFEFVVNNDKTINLDIESLPTVSLYYVTIKCPLDEYDGIDTVYYGIADSVNIFNPVTFSENNKFMEGSFTVEAGTKIDLKVSTKEGYQCTSDQGFEFTVNSNIIVNLNTIYIGQDNEEKYYVTLNFINGRPQNAYYTIDSKLGAQPCEINTNEDTVVLELDTNSQINITAIATDNKAYITNELMYIGSPYVKQITTSVFPSSNKGDVIVDFKCIDVYKLTIDANNQYIKTITLYGLNKNIILNKPVNSAFVNEMLIPAGTNMTWSWVDENSDEYRSYFELSNTDHVIDNGVTMNSNNTVYFISTKRSYDLTINLNNKFYGDDTPSNLGDTNVYKNGVILNNLSNKSLSEVLNTALQNKTNGVFNCRVNYGDDINIKLDAINNDYVIMYNNDDIESFSIDKSFKVTPQNTNNPYEIVIDIDIYNAYKFVIQADKYVDSIEYGSSIGDIVGGDTKTILYPNNKYVFETYIKAGTRFDQLDMNVNFNVPNALVTDKRLGNIQTPRVVDSNVTHKMITKANLPIKLGKAIDTANFNYYDPEKEQYTNVITGAMWDGTTVIEPGNIITVTEKWPYGVEVTPVSVSQGDIDRVYIGCIPESLINNGTGSFELITKELSECTFTVTFTKDDGIVKVEDNSGKVLNFSNNVSKLNVTGDGKTLHKWTATLDEGYSEITPLSVNITYNRDQTVEFKTKQQNQSTITIVKDDTIEKVEYSVDGMQKGEIIFNDNSTTQTYYEGKNVIYTAYTKEGYEFSGGSKTAQEQITVSKNDQIVKFTSEGGHATNKINKTLVIQNDSNDTDIELKFISNSQDFNVNESTLGKGLEKTVNVPYGTSFIVLVETNTNDYKIHISNRQNEIENNMIEFVNFTEDVDISITTILNKKSLTIQVTPASVFEEVNVYELNKLVQTYRSDYFNSSIILNYNANAELNVIATVKEDSNYLLNGKTQQSKNVVLDDNKSVKFTATGIPLKIGFTSNLNGGGVDNDINWARLYINSAEVGKFGANGDYSMNSLSNNMPNSISSSTYKYDGTTNNSQTIKYEMGGNSSDKITFDVQTTLIKGCTCKYLSSTNNSLTMVSGSTISENFQSGNSNWFEFELTDIQPGAEIVFVLQS